MVDPAVRMEHRICVDSRESRSRILPALRAIEGLSVEIQQLDADDYLIDDSTAVERKAASDFVLSLLDGRFHSQVAKMKLSYGRPILLIEGNIYKTRSAIEPAALAAAVSYLTLEGVTVICTDSEAESALYLVALSRHLHFGLAQQPMLRPGKPKPSRDMAKFILQGLPGVGAVNSEGLIDHFGSVHAVMGASAVELATCPGIGKKTAERIVESIRWSCR